MRNVLALLQSTHLYTLGSCASQVLDGSLALVQSLYVWNMNIIFENEIKTVVSAKSVALYCSCNSAMTFMILFLSLGISKMYCALLTIPWFVALKSCHSMKIALLSFSFGNMSLRSKAPNVLRPGKLLY